MVQWFFHFHSVRPSSEAVWSKSCFPVQPFCILPSCPRLMGHAGTGFSTPMTLKRPSVRITDGRRDGWMLQLVSASNPLVVQLDFGLLVSLQFDFSFSSDLPFASEHSLVSASVLTSSEDSRCSVAPSPALLLKCSQKDKQ